MTAIAVRAVLALLLALPLLAPAEPAPLAPPAGSVVRGPISFVYAVYTVGPFDPVVAARVKALGVAQGVRMLDALPKDSADVVAVATVLKDAAKEYAPPDETLLRYFGHGLSREQAAAIQKAKGAFVLEVQFPAGRMSQGLKAASVLIERAAIDGKGFIWDEETRELFTPKAWRERRIDTWAGDIPDATSQTVIHAYKGDAQVRAITLGMRKFGLPDVVINDFSWSSVKPMGNLLNGVIQALAEGAQPGKAGELAVDVRKLHHPEVKKTLLAELVKGATAVAKVKLVRAEPEEGDPRNRLLAIDFDAYPGPDRYAKQDAMLAALFGKGDDKVTRITHTDRLKAASRLARTHLPELRTAFNRGLPPGEYIQLKAPFKTPEGGNEWMWVEVTSWQGRAIKGLLKNEPYEIPTLQAGQMVTVNEDEVFDYLRTEANGKQTGNETSKIIAEMNSAR